MTATFEVHVDPADDGVVWWAASDDIEGLSVAADHLGQLKTLIGEAVALHRPGETDIALNLVVDESVEPEPPGTVDLPEIAGVLPSSRGAHVRSTWPIGVAI